MTKQEIEKVLKDRPELLEVIQAAASLKDPVDLRAVVDYANTLKEKGAQK